MQLIDLSLVVNESTPVYPGDPKIKIEPLGTFEKDGLNDHYVSFPTHVGTHIDAPLHMIDGGKTLDEMPIEHFIGRGRLVEGVGVDNIRKANIQQDDIVLFHTGHIPNLYQKSYFDDFPEMNKEVANYLIAKKVKVIGLDTPSPDHPPYKIHRLLLGAGILIIENLTNLNKLVGKDFTVYALPIKLALDGAPARVIAKVE